MTNSIVLSIRIVLTLILLYFGLTISGIAQTNVPAIVSSNQVWTLSGSPYRINQNTYIDTGVRILVQPGVEIVGTSNYRIDINGEFQAIGKWDTTISIRTVQLNFTEKSKGYKRSTGRGARFEYCNFDGVGGVTTMVNLNAISVKIDHCEFRRSYFAVYMLSTSTKDTMFVDISHSGFYGNGSGHGSPIRSNVQKSKLNIYNCDFMDADYIYTYGNLTLRNNTFNRVNSISAEYLYGKNEMSCNLFKNMNGEIALDISGYTCTGELYFEYNTIDSVATTGFPNRTLAIKRPMSNSPQFGPVYINYNNFLYRKAGGSKLAFTGSNQNVFTTDTIDCRFNYWGTADTTVIASWISDYKSDINIYGRADYSSFASVAITSCSYNSNCAQPGFSFAVTDNTVQFTDQSVSSKAYKVRWSFGDGMQNDSNKKTVQHTYSNAGNYYACIYTYDSLDNLCDSLCKRIHIEEEMPCKADFYFAVDAQDPKSVYIVNSSKGIKPTTSYNWTFGDGNSSSLEKPVHSYASAGQYQICLSISENSINCNSNFCDSFLIKTGNNLIVLNESDFTGIENEQKGMPLQVYPNPGSEIVTLTFMALETGNAAIEISNIEGKIVKAESMHVESGTHEIQLDVSSLENGIYFIRCSSQGSSKIIRLIVNK